jgi:hypothetical protein
MRMTSLGVLVGKLAEYEHQYLLPDVPDCTYRNTRNEVSREPSKPSGQAQLRYGKLTMTSCNSVTILLPTSPA